MDGDYKKGAVLFSKDCWNCHGLTFEEKSHGPTLGMIYGTLKGYQ